MKIVLIGDSGVGKTALLSRLETNTFSPESSPTIGGGFIQLTINTTLNPDDGTPEETKCVPNSPNCNNEYDENHFNVGIWDTAGQERFKTVVPMYFQKADIIIMVFSVDDPKTFQNIETWKQLAEESAPPEFHKILLGNKTDIRVSRPEGSITFDQGIELANAMGAPYIETSAKTGWGIDNLIQEFRNVYIDINKKNKEENEKEPAQEVNIQQTQTVTQQKCGC